MAIRPKAAWKAGASMSSGDPTSSRGHRQPPNRELAAANRELENEVRELESTADDLRNFLASTEIATIFLDTELRIRRFTPVTGALLNVTPADVGRSISELSPRVRDPDLFSDATIVLARLAPREREVASEGGRWFIRRVLPYRVSDGHVEGVVVTFTDVTRLKETEARLRRRDRQQAVVAVLGRRALAEVPVSELLDEAVARVAETLENEFCHVLELQADGKDLLLISGVGWEDGLIGKATVPSTRSSQAGYTLHAKWPVVVEDVSRETRFSGPPLLADHGVVSGLSVVIGPWEQPWGVLGTHSRRRQTYTDDDVNFLQSVAHLIWQAIAAHKSRKDASQHEQELRLIADSAPVLIAHIDEGLRYRFNSAAYERWFGISRGDMYGESMRSVLGEETYRRVEPEVARALAGERVTFELDLRNKNGQTKSTLVNYVPRRDEGGRVSGFYAVIADVTDLKRAEERLRLSQEAGGVGTWDWNVSRSVAICSEEYFRIYGLKPREELSRREWLERIHPEDREGVERGIEEALGGTRPFEGEFRIVRPDGEERWIAARARVILDEQGAPERLVGVNIDVTSRKRAEIRSEKAQADLAKANRLKDEFLAMLGHELRNPLGAISNGIQLLLGGPESEHREWAERMIARQTRQLERLVDDLLDVSRIERGLIEVRKEVVDLASSVEGALQSVHDLIDENERRLDVRLPKGALHLMADPARIEQILGNLLSNAVKYTEKGGRIELSAEREGDEVVVRVADDGQGLPSDCLEVVFQPFVRVGPSERRAGDGLGIGLTLVKKLTELHGGTVSAWSEGAGKGSEFVVRFPLYHGARSEGVTGEPTEIVAEDPLRILVIDDNRDLAESLGKILEGMGHEVRLAFDGPGGIELARRFQPQVALVDVGLPGMDGFEVAERLRGSRRLWIGAVSGYKEELQEGATRGNFDHYFIKPLERDALAQVLAGLTVAGEVS